MSERKHELILIGIALVISAILILYNTFTVPSEYVSSSSQTLTSGVSSSASAEVTTSTDKAVVVNINTASAEELTLIVGIGPTKAEAIVKYRLENGPFDSVDELLDVSGIGPSTLQKIYPYVTV